MLLFSITTISLILFSPSQPYFNTDIGNIEVIETSLANEGYEITTISTEMIYLYKETTTLTIPEGERSDWLPVKIETSSRIKNPEGTSGTHKLLTKDNLALEFSKSYLYKNEIVLKEDKEHNIRIAVYAKRYYDYPRPYHGEGRWEEIGLKAVDINLQNPS